MMRENRDEIIVHRKHIQQDLPLYTWDLAYYRDRSLTETHSEPSASLLSFYKNRDTPIAPRTLIWNEYNPQVLCRIKGDRK